MSSKKKRKNIRAFYERRNKLITSGSKPGSEKTYETNPTNTSKEEIAAIELKKIIPQFKGMSVLFPEIELENPMELGVFYEATIQIGNDKPIEKRLILANMAFNDVFNQDSVKKVEWLKKILNENVKDGIITSFNSKEQEIPRAANPKIFILYEIMFVYMMVPMESFDWYGREGVKISELKECPRAKRVVGKFQPFITMSFLMFGQFIGRDFDGMEVFEPETEIEIKCYDLLEKLEKVFEEMHPSWGFLKQFLVNIVTEYVKKPKEISQIEVPLNGEVLDYFLASVSSACGMISQILDKTGIEVKSMGGGFDNLRISF